MKKGLKIKVLYSECSIVYAKVPPEQNVPMKWIAGTPHECWPRMANVILIQRCQLF